MGAGRRREVFKLGRGMSLLRRGDVIDATLSGALSQKTAHERGRSGGKGRVFLVEKGETVPRQGFITVRGIHEKEGRIGGGPGTERGRLNYWQSITLVSYLQRWMNPRGEDKI